MSLGEATRKNVGLDVWMKIAGNVIWYDGHHSITTILSIKLMHHTLIALNFERGTN